MNAPEKGNYVTDGNKAPRDRDETCNEACREHAQSLLKRRINEYREIAQSASRTAMELEELANQLPARLSAPAEAALYHLMSRMDRPKGLL